MTRVIDRPVLVLNRGWEPVGVFDVATAITTVIRDMGWVLDTEDYQRHDFASWRRTEPKGHVIKTPTGGVPAPEIIILREYGHQPKRRVPLTRRNLWRRDDERCQFCGQAVPFTEATIDHVFPRSRGGPTSWENCVTACGPCNRRKADRTPHEAGMQLLTQPARPRMRPTLRVAREHYRTSWQPFVAKAPFELELRG